MLATLVIGLREGLEASLIVGIIAAFLSRTGKSLRPMWIGVASAIALSIGVGVVLEVISADLPQAQQEGMESIIGFVAVIFVTGMIGWMNQHARNLRSDLEHSAASALRDGTVWALVGMAFLAVLKEGFETSVFLLAAFQSSTSSLAAGAGAVIGIAVAVGIGIGIYRGGIKLNLARFFRVTGLFLVLVAAGLVLSAIRTAHEAGWILIGQQATVNLSWLAPNGSVQAALLTGVLGIPSDPRLIEVLGWFAYLVPVLLYLLWPASRRPSPARKPALLFGLAGATMVAAIVLAVAVPLPGAYSPGAAKLVSAGGDSAGTASLTRSGNAYSFDVNQGGAVSSHAFSFSQTKPDGSDGIASRLWQNAATSSESQSLSLVDLIALSGGRVPIGIDPSQNPGPFSTTRETRATLSVRASGSTLLDASLRSVSILTLSGGGLNSPRTITVESPKSSPSWSATSSYVARTAAGIAAAASARTELLLWKLYLPVVLVVAALLLAFAGYRGKRILRKRERVKDGDVAGSAAGAAAAPQPARV